MCAFCFLSSRKQTPSCRGDGHLETRAGDWESSAVVFISLLWGKTLSLVLSPLPCTSAGTIMPNAVEVEAPQCYRGTWSACMQLDVPERGVEQLSLSRPVGIHAGYVPELYSGQM